MKKLLAILFSILMLPLAFAYDSATPYSITLQWYIPADTTFTVAVCGSRTAISFNNTARTDTYIEPDCQNRTNKVPMLTITNAGNVQINLTNNLTTQKPSWAVVASSANTSLTSFRRFDVVNWTKIPNSTMAVGGNVMVFFYTNLTNAATGLTTRTYHIKSNDLG